MKVQPDGAELLRVARETLLRELLPRMPEESRYAARMVANAMAIAARELAAPADVHASRHSVSKLAADIRAGRFDDAQAWGQLRDRLREITRARLAVSNPRILESGKGP